MASPNSGGAAADANDSTQVAPETSTVLAKGRGSVGLYNQGATCYLNCLLQLLHHTTFFRSAVYKMSSGSRDLNSTPKALQLLFYQMQVRDAAFSTKVLTDAFGWSGSDLFEQHDIHELVTLLRDAIEETMKGTPSEGAINRLFGGMSEKFFRCLDGSYTSRKLEDFYDLQVQVQGFQDLQSSIKSTLAVEQLTGSNKYRVEEEGKEPVYKDAETGTRFIKFPPVLVCHLKRIEMDLESPTLEMKKINQPFSFPEVLDLREIETGCAPGQEGPKPLEDGLDDGEAIYDLYGIIVHRGGVRVGHYFCYMRQWDSAAQAWGDWLEYDDETVRAVPSDVAIDTNFGGTVTRTNNHGYRVQVLSPQNAYILAYVRRSHTPKVFYEEDTANIPADVKEEFDRVVAEEEKKRKAAEEAAKYCTLHVVTDASISRHVDAHKFDIGSGREIQAETTVVVRKADTWDNAMIQVAEALKITPQAFRLWVCENRALQTYGHGWRVANVVNESSTHLHTFQGPRGDGTTVEEELGAFISQPHGGQSAAAPTPWTLTVYAHVATQTPQHHLDNAAAFATNVQMSSSRTERPVHIHKEPAPHRFHPEDANPQFAVTLGSRYSVETVRFRVHHIRHASGHPLIMSVTCSAFFNNSPVAAKTLQVDTTQPIEALCFNFGGVKVDQLHVQRTVPQGAHILPFAVSRLQVIVPPAELERFKTAPQLLLPSPRAHILVQLKYFNPRAGSLHFLGSCMVPALEPLRNSLPILLDRAGIGAATSGYTLFDERSPSDQAELSLDGMPFDPATTPGNYLRHGSIVILQEDARDVPLCFQHPRADCFLRTYNDLRHMTVRNIATPQGDVEAIVPMQGRWKFPRIVDAVAKAVGADPDYVRFYMSASVRKPYPRDEPERSESELTLAQAASVGEWPTTDLWYEVLSVKRIEQERIVAVKATVTDERGNPVGEDPDASHAQFDLGADATASDVIEGVLERCGTSFNRPFALLVIFDRVIRHVLPASPQEPNKTKVHPLFVRHSDRTFEVRPYTPPAGDEIEYTVALGQYGTTPLMHGAPFVTRLPHDATPEVALKHLQAVTEVPDEDLCEYKIMMYTTAALYFRDFDMLLTEYWRLTQFQQRPSLMLDCKRPKEKPGSRYVSQGNPTLSINKRKSGRAGS